MREPAFSGLLCNLSIYTKMAIGKQYPFGLANPPVFWPPDPHKQAGDRAKTVIWGQQRVEVVLGYGGVLLNLISVQRRSFD